MLDEIHIELIRIDAPRILVTLDEEFEPAAGQLVRVELDEAYWHLLPEQFLELLRELPAGVGADDVRQAIERQAVGVWHGPSPPDSRDTSA